MLAVGCTSPAKKVSEPAQVKKVQEINSKHYTLEDIHSAFDQSEGFKEFAWNDEAALKESGPIVFDEVYKNGSWQLQICVFDSNKDAKYYFDNELANFADSDKSIPSSHEDQIVQVDSDYSQFYIYKIQNQTIAGMQGSYVNEYNDETDKALQALDEFLSNINNE